MHFTRLQLAYFDAQDGAASIVTPTEAADPQITVDPHEKEVIYSVIPEGRIYRGSRNSGGAAAMQPFTVHGTDEPLSLPMVFPKDTGTELRIYVSRLSAFCPNAGDVWFVYRRQGRLYIGSMQEMQWRRLGTDDPADEQLQDAIDHGTDSPIDCMQSGRRYLRNPAISRAALAGAGYQCDYCPATELFISRATGNPYVEAHHLIPLFATERLGAGSLDVAANIFALAPHWHRAIHSAESPLVIAILRQLSSRRPALLTDYSLSLDDLIDIYGCGEIE